MSAKTPSQEEYLGREGTKGSGVDSCVVLPSPAVLSLSLQPARDCQQSVVAVCPCTDGSRAPCPGGHTCLCAPTRGPVFPAVPSVPPAAAEPSERTVSPAHLAVALLLLCSALCGGSS